MRTTTILATALGVGLGLGLASGCNAVFGIDETSFGTGGAGGEGASSTSTDSSASSSSGGPDLCETKDWIVGGDFAVDEERFWDESDNVTVTAEVIDGDRVMRIDPVEGVEASTTQTLSNEPICTSGCIRVSFEARALASFVFGVGVSDDDTDEGGLRLIGDRNIATSTTFQSIATEPCLIPPDFVSPDRVSFAFKVEGGDMYVDDVMLIVDDCPAEADLCERF
jgi:hypothetical protein